MPHNRTTFPGVGARGRLAQSQFSWILVLTLGLWVTTVQAGAYRYHYIALNGVRVPSGFLGFSPSAIDDHGKVYGTCRDALTFEPHVAVYHHGVVTVLQPGNAGVVNARGTIGGFVTDPQTGNVQAALFRGTQVELIPFLPGETQTFVVSLNDFDTALVWSEDPSGLVRTTYRLYTSTGQTPFRFQIPTGSDCSACWGVNNHGVVTGTIYDPTFNAFRALRFRPPYDAPLSLDPLPTDSDSGSGGINNLGYILGSSSVFLNPDPTQNRIGVWDRKGKFKTYFEGIGYFALFNDTNLIVLTQNFDTDFNSYLVPRPGVRLNIADLVENPTAVTAPLAQVVDINNHGDMVGYGLCTSSPCPRFLLRRLGPRAPR